MFWLDGTILAALALGALLGALSGFLWQMARLLGLALALYLAILLNETVSQFVQTHYLAGADPRMVRIVAYVGVFLVVYLVLLISTYWLYQAMRAVHLEPLDRLLGALLGLGKMALILAAVFLGLANYPHPKTKELMEKSILAPVLAGGMEIALVVIPQEYRNELCEGFNHLRDLARNKGNAEEGFTENTMTEIEYVPIYFSQA